MNRKASANSYWKNCLIASVGWAAIAAMLSIPLFGFQSIFGLVAAPLLGLLSGVIGLQFAQASSFHRGLVSLLTLYLSAACFGLIIGFSSALLSGNQNLGGASIEGVLGVLWGLSIPWVLFVLWPLSFLTHCYVGDELNSES